MSDTRSQPALSCSRIVRSAPIEVTAEELEEASRNPLGLFDALMRQFEEARCRREEGR